MSTDQPRGAETVTAAAWNPVPESECLGCGADVDADTRRVLGDNSDRVRRCPECAPITSLSQGLAAHGEQRHHSTEVRLRDV